MNQNYNVNGKTLKVIEKERSMAWKRGIFQVTLNNNNFK